MSLAVACGADEGADGQVPAPAASEEEPLLPPQPRNVDTIEEAQELAEFTLTTPASLPEGMSFAGASVYRVGGGQYVDLGYRWSDAVNPDARAGVIITQSADGFRIGRAASPVQVQGVTGWIIRGEDVQNPGLLAVQWKKNGITYSAMTFPNDIFSEEDFMQMLNTIR